MCRHSYLFIRFFILTIGGTLVGGGLVQPGRSHPPFQPPEQPLPLDSSGPSGINAQVLQAQPYGLTGKKISIGQVEPGRPGLFGYDKQISSRVTGLPLAGLFFRNKSAPASRHVDDHAHSVASLMVGQTKGFQGIAPEARLYSAALGSRRMGAGQPDQCLTLTHIAQQNGGDVRAINLSFGESLRLDQRPNPTLDGNALLTQCLDWSARTHDTLYVVAGNQGKGGIPIPTDQYNGLTVAYTRRKNQVFRKVDFANLGDELEAMADRFVGRERNLNGRGSVGLVAPGNELLIPDPEGEVVKLSGTSFAAPHVTATVALLQEQGDRMLRANPQPNDTQPNSPQLYDTASRRHEVMKAILLNSADKLRDRGNGLHLGMTKTILGQNNLDWSQSPASGNPAMPLDPLMGAGQVNAQRAYEQLEAGRGGDLTGRGWDYGVVGNPVFDDGATMAPVRHRDYAIGGTLQQDSYFSATLAWDRRVELVDSNGNGEYDLGERFRDRGLNNLDLYLMPADEEDIRRSIWSSTSPVDSVEHIFQQIPQTGRYKLRVQYTSQRNEPSQAYGLAWWGMSVAAAAP